MKQSLLSWRPGSRTSSACRRASPSARLSDTPCHPPGRPQSLGSPAAPVRSVCPVPAATPRWSLRAPMLLEGHHLLSRGPKMQPPSRGRPGPRAAPEENRHPPLYPPTSSSGPGGAALPSQLHPSPLEPSLSLVPGSAQGGGPEWVGGSDKTFLPVPPRIPFGAHAPLLPQSRVASWGSEQPMRCLWGLGGGCCHPDTTHPPFHSLPVAGSGWRLGGQQEQHPFVLHPPVLLPAHLGPAGGAPNPLTPLGDLPFGAQRHQSLCFGCGGAGGSPGSRSAGQQSYSLPVHTSAQAPLALPQAPPVCPLLSTDLEISAMLEPLHLSMMEHALGPLPSQLHPSPLEPSLSLVPGSAQGGGPEWVWGVVKPLYLSPPAPLLGPTPPCSPKSSVASWGSEQTEEPAGGCNTFEEEGSGMKDVPSWLESLGLREYTALFSQMTYEEMMRLTEHHLESQNVPRGARQRILLSIQKLRERPSVLRALEKRILWGGSLWPALQELRQIIVTPIKASNAAAPVPYGDIPRLFTCVMGKVCIQFLVSRPDKENIISYLELLEQCQGHEAFTETQKKRLLSWWWQVQWLLRTFPLGADQQLAPGPARPPPGASPPRHGPGDQPHA
ncbi:uncharacterized protein LOC141974088 isoform X2 [Athene noctua]|uniref:uncharacterized protein LOC141974088 isoform X2 n=1 Tax=Athene noctua TaxID=126797 RepID=UPI003EBF0227